MLLHTSTPVGGEPVCTLSLIGRGGGAVYLNGLVRGKNGGYGRGGGRVVLFESRDWGQFFFEAGLERGYTMLASVRTVTRKG